MYQHKRPALGIMQYLCLVALFFVLTVLGMQPRAALAEQFMLIPSAPSVVAGSTIGFAGSGFIPDERVSIWFTSPRQSVLGGGYANTLENSRFSYEFEVPSEALGGVWSITAYGDTSRSAVIATFRVLGQEPKAADLLAAVQPVSAPAGTTFAFAATGFKDNELISYWITGPDGLVKAAYDREARANSDGRVDLTWSAATNAASGTWVLTAQGIKSHVARGIPFVIQ